MLFHAAVNHPNTLALFKGALQRTVAAVVGATLGVTLSASIASAQGASSSATELRPAEMPPLNENEPFRDFWGAFRGPDYRLTVYAEGTGTFLHDDGSRALIEFDRIDINTQSRPEWVNKRVALGRVSASEGSAPPVDALIAFQPNLDPFKDGRALLIVYTEPDANILFADMICHPIIGNGAWENYPCW